MPTLYLYELSSFSTPAPNEGGGGGGAVGTPDFTITTGSTLSLITIEVTDNDSIISENGGNNQVLTNETTINGVTYPAGTQIRADYYLTADNGEKVISISVGGGNSGSDTSQGILSTVALVPNQSYVFTEESNANPDFTPSAIAQSYTEYVVCFVRGTHITTSTGDRKVETLSVGDLVATADRGFQSIRWIGRKPISKMRLKANPHLYPILISKDSFGRNIPNADLYVSPQHRILLSSFKLNLYCGFNEALAPAKSLVNGTSIKVAEDVDQTEYFHILFDQHEIIKSNGTWTESFYPGHMAITALENDTKVELFEIFPDLKVNSDNFSKMARPALKVHEGRLFAP